MSTLGQQAAAIIFSPETLAKVKARGFKLTQPEVAAIFDALCPQKAPKTSNKADSSPFGDRRAIPPTPAQVEAYSASIGYPMDGQAWCDSYAQKGWKVGKAKMVDWQAAVRNWKRNGWVPARATTTPPAGKDYTKL